MNKRMKKKYGIKKASLQEAWDIVAQHLVELKGGDDSAHTFFINSIGGYMNIEAVHDEIVLRSTLSTAHMAHNMKDKYKNWSVFE